MIHSKFILYDGELRIGRVSRHRELLPAIHSTGLIQGGGQFEVDNDTMEILFFGRSVDYGPFDRAILERAIADQNWNLRRLKDYKLKIM